MSEAISSAAPARLLPEAIYALSDGRIVHANAATATRLGLEKSDREDQALRRSCARLHDRSRARIGVPSWRRKVIGPSDFARFADALAR